MSERHKVIVGRVYYIDAETPFVAMEQAIDRDKSGEIDVDALEIHVTIGSEEDQ
jgi:hypothetical protein